VAEIRTSAGEYDDFASPLAAAQRTETDRQVRHSFPKSDKLAASRSIVMIAEIKTLWSGLIAGQLPLTVVTLLVISPVRDELIETSFAAALIETRLLVCA